MRHRCVPIRLRDTILLRPNVPASGQPWLGAGLPIAIFDLARLTRKRARGYLIKPVAEIIKLEKFPLKFKFGLAGRGTHTRGDPNVDMQKKTLQKH